MNGGQVKGLTFYYWDEQIDGMSIEWGSEVEITITGLPAHAMIAFHDESFGGVYGPSFDEQYLDEPFLLWEVDGQAGALHYNVIDHHFYREGSPLGGFRVHDGDDFVVRLGVDNGGWWDLQNFSFYIYLPTASISGGDLVSESDAGTDKLEYTVSRDLLSSGSPWPGLIENDEVPAVKVYLDDPVGTATENADYKSYPREITIPAGTAGVLFEVEVIDDDHLEPNETIIIPIAPGAGYTLHSVNDRATGTIVDNDPVDLDADSDNTDLYAVPDHSDHEDQIEADDPGKYIAVQKTFGEGPMVPLVVDLSDAVDLTGATAGFSISGETGLRIWSDEERTQLITSGSAQQLGLTAGNKTTFYVEAQSAGAADVEFSIDFPNQPNDNRSDSVRYTVLSPRVDQYCEYGPQVGGELDRRESVLNGRLLSVALGGSANGLLTDMAESAKMLLLGNAIAIVEGLQVRIYDFPGLTPRIEGQGKLTAEGGAYTEYLPDGRKLQFTLPGGGGLPPRLDKIRDAADQETQRVYDIDGNLDYEQAVRGDYTERAHYSYDGEGHVTRIMLTGQRGAGSEYIIRYADYIYYGADEAGGNEGLLKRVEIRGPDEALIETKYYRYYKDDSSGGFTNALKYAFGPAGYAMLLQAGLGESSTDAQIEAYADEKFVYDSSGRVAEIVLSGNGCSTCSGGQGTTTFDYDTRVGSGGYNSWTTKRTETLEDGTVRITFSNFANQPMLEIVQADSQEHRTFYRYDTNGRRIMTAHPSAVTGYDQNLDDLLGCGDADSDGFPDSSYINATGLVELTEYYEEGDSSPGAAAGEIKRFSIRQGDTGTIVPQREYTYEVRQVDDARINVVKTQTVFRNDDGTGAITTTYDYTWFGDDTPGNPNDDTTQMKSRTVTRPVISALQNGPDVASVETSVFDNRGQVIWMRDAEGFIQHFAYDDNGALIQSIVDVDTSLVTDEPAGWVTPTGGGMHLVSQYQNDDFGRTTKAVDPNGNVTYTVYNDADHEVRTYRGWTGSNTTGPIEVVREDLGRGYYESLTYWADLSSISGAIVGGVPQGTESIDNLLSLQRSYMNAGGQVVAVDHYFDVSVAYSVAGYFNNVTGEVTNAPGTEGVHYYRTLMDYDKLGRTKRVENPEGTITRYEYDGLGRLTSTWIGTDDEPTSGHWSPTNNAGANMVKVSENVYDFGNVGDGNLTKTIQYASSTDQRVTEYAYDWRNRLVAVKSGSGASVGAENEAVNRQVVYFELDNLGRQTAQLTYDGDTVNIYADANSDGIPDKPSASRLRGKQMTEYDDLGRVFRTSVFSVDPANGDISANALVSNTWYDKRGNAIKTSQPGGLITKMQYDGAGRLTKLFNTDGGGDSSWADADDVTGDIVLEQVEYGYDDAGNLLLTTARQRFHDATGTGELGDPSSSQPKARVAYSASYYDAAHRTTATVNVGTNGGSAYARPGTVPSRSDNALVTEYVYDDAGRLWKVIDPKGIESRTEYDAMGRTTATIEAYEDGVPESNEPDLDRVTRYTYDGNSNVLTMTADLAANDQTTTYAYGVTTASGSDINSNDLLTSVTYPDDGNGSTSETETFTYNAIGQATSKTDRNGTTHDYGYDALGRLTSDTVDALGTGVDGAIRSLGFTYNSQGLPWQFTSYDGSDDVVNQVTRQYNGLGQLIREYQEHDGEVDGSTPSVQYTYSEMAGGANHSRRTGMIYPDGRTVGYSYDTGLDNTISRLSALKQGSLELEAFSYLGLGTVVERMHEETGIDLTYVGTGIGPGGDQYAGLDRFGRIVDQRWTNGTTDTDRFTYGYDRNSNRLYEENLLDTSKSELYGPYDQLNRLINFDRGELNGTKDGITGTSERSQSWELDPLGNWSEFETSEEGGSSGAQTAPAAPSSLNATADGSSRINLTWTDNANNETIFKIERKTGSGGTWAQVGLAAAGATSFTDYGLDDQTTYYYRVSAANTLDSSYSNEDSATTSAAMVAVSTFLSDLTPTSVTNPYFTYKKDKSVAGNTMTIGGQTYSKGLGMHSHSQIVYTLNGGYDTFDAIIGIDDEEGDGANEGSAQWLVYVDSESTPRYTSPRRTGADGPYTIPTVDISGATTLKLVTNTGGQQGDNDWKDHANWAEARVGAPGTPASAPDAPSGVSATAAGGARVEVAWTDNAGDEDGFVIERRVAGTGSWAQVGVVGENQTGYTDMTGLVAGTQYDYRVVAFNAGGGSVSTNTDDATTITPVVPAAPTSPSASADGAQVEFTWSHGGGNESGFEIERATDSGFTANVVRFAGGANVAEFIDDSADASTTYHYRVRATGEAGSSAWTSGVSETTGAAVTPTLSGSFTTDTTTRNLTDDGESDWIQWNNHTGGINRKSGGGSTISTYTPAGHGLHESSTGLDRLLSWSDGTPTGSHGGNGNGAKINDVGSSMTFTVPASTQERTLKVYAYGWYSNIQLEVSLSDDSASPWISAVTGSGSGNTYYRTFTVVYRAGSDGQTATVKLKNVAGQQPWGQMGLQGAAVSITDAGGGGGTGTPPAAASSLTVDPVSPTQVNLAWADNASTETGFVIERATDSGFTTGLTRFAVGPNVTRFADTSAEADTTYHYRVVATGEGGSASPSSSASATTAATTSGGGGGGSTSVTQTRTHNAQNQLTGIDDGTTQTPLTYDANGNLTTDHNGNTLIYDAWNRLVEVTDGSATLQRYEHDALRRRIAENAHTPTPTKLFYSADWQVIEERENGIPTAQYVWSPVYVDAMILRDRDANANPADGLEQRHYVQHDANFNVTAITDPTGTVVERYLYDPYGQATVLAANWQPITGNHAWQYLHQGGRYDPATTLHHFRNRDYSAELGRWVQQDPLGYVDGMSLYEYLRSGTTTSIDPLGLQAQACSCPPETRMPSERDPSPGDDPWPTTTLLHGTGLKLQYVGNTMTALTRLIIIGRVENSDNFYYEGSVMVRLVKNSEQYRLIQEAIGTNLKIRVENWARENPNGSTQLTFSDKASGAFTGLGSNMMLGQFVVRANTKVDVTTSACRADGKIAITARYQLDWHLTDDHNFNAPVVEPGTFYKHLYWKGNNRNDTWTINP